MKHSADNHVSRSAICGCASLLVLAPIHPATAATTFNGGDLVTSTNWSNELPAAGNDGTIAVDGSLGNVPIAWTGSAITQSAGTLAVNAFNLTGMTYNLEGGAINCRYVLANAGSTINLSGGTVTRTTTGGGYMGVLNGTINISDTAVIDMQLGASNPFISGTGTFNFNSGWTGSWTQGSFSAETWKTSFTTNAAYQLDGVNINATTFDSVFQITNDGKTLSMIPEPGTTSLMAAFGLMALLPRRRNARGSKP